MKLKVVPASQGLLWVRQGMRLCLKQPLTFVSLLGMMLTSAMLLMAVPLLGLFVVVAAMPVVWMVFMLASRQVAAGQRVTPLLLAEPLRSAPQRMQWLKLGALYALATVVIMVLAGLLGPGLGELATALESVDGAQAAWSHPVVQASVLWRLGLTVPVALLFWHTPALLHWGQVPVGKALFFSAVASWRNLGAFVLYGAGWAGALLALGAAVQLISVVLPVPVLAAMAAVAGGMWWAAAFYASLYFSVVDCFEPDAPHASDGREPPPSDLVV